MARAKTNPKSNQSPVDDLSYEQALEELESIVAKLEGNKLTLEAAMELYERGQAISKHCIALLDNAELRIKKLSGDTLVDMTLEG